MLLTLAGIASTAMAQNVKVANAWTRATPPGQNSASVYLELTSDSDAALVAAGSPSADRAELHTMTAQGGVMRMRPLPRMDLPAGQTVKLAPNGAHLMLLGLKQPLKQGDRLSIVLSVQSSGTSLTTVKIEAEVRALHGSTAHSH
jgi:periplasmic copper chaperone A